MGTPSCQFVRNAADETFDQVFQAAALSVTNAVQIEDGTVSVDGPDAALAILGTSRLKGVFCPGARMRWPTCKRWRAHGREI